MAEDARKMREDAAGEAKRRIDEASDAGIQNRSWWEDVGDWFTDNWDSIVAVCKIVVAVVGVVAMIIGGVTGWGAPEARAIDLTVLDGGLFDVALGSEESGVAFRASAVRLAKTRAYLAWDN
ncbi:hypothetical protein QFZ49_002241 [Streptomyces turgidiscabies]|uniref:Uncharacterized protein n=1 Tax=Streptomyces turgidiscabies TaxID=85558 RepID=A0ABU0RK01_9ACTN|nr:hypothetical protein [Streptomyces turgidiscabies]